MPKRVPLSLAELVLLKPGDNFIVYWAKDDNDRDIRCNYEEQVVESVDPDNVLTTNGYRWYFHRDIVLTPEENMINGDRGTIYFYKA